MLSSLVKNWTFSRVITTIFASFRYSEWPGGLKYGPDNTRADPDSNPAETGFGKAAIEHLEIIIRVGFKYKARNTYRIGFLPLKITVVCSPCGDCLLFYISILDAEVHISGSVLHGIDRKMRKQEVTFYISENLTTNALLSQSNILHDILIVHVTDLNVMGLIMEITSETLYHL